ncbi:scopoletin glucosyltransferase-like [Iris pallida]|uniref:Scopoletin glucosyltransferase-like n=1 Tax=Iris pallida TaxID=29817 RepID=A0AAX6E5Z6_IRIPA|nr:scopoletin glucosyltransferase-like [Iris pallida]
MGSADTDTQPSLGGWVRDALRVELDPRGGERGPPAGDVAHVRGAILQREADRGRAGDRSVGRGEGVRYEVGRQESGGS